MKQENTNKQQHKHSQTKNLQAPQLLKGATAKAQTDISAAGLLVGVWIILHIKEDRCP